MQSRPTNVGGQDFTSLKSNNLSVTILGDVVIDITCTIGDKRFRDLNEQTFLYSPISVSPAGTGVRLAMACTTYFQTVKLLCRMGSDSFASELKSFLEERNITVLASTDTEIATGVVVKLNELDFRLMIGPKNSASQQLTVQDVRNCAKAFQESDLFVTDGYCIMRQPRRDATFEAMHLANLHNIPVAFDIVPHNAYDFYSLTELTKILAAVDIVITELGTIRNFLGLNTGEEINADLAEETAKLLMSKFQGKHFLLRYGSRNMSDNSLVCFVGEKPRHIHNGYTESNDKDGFGDRLAARELREYIQNCVPKEA